MIQGWYLDAPGLILGTFIFRSKCRYFSMFLKSVSMFQYFPSRYSNGVDTIVKSVENNGDPNRKPAPPAFNPNAEKEINEKTKDAVAIMNNDNPGIKDKLFKDLGDSFLFDKSFMRNFYSTSNTKVPNDQDSFAKFLYGDMNSCKDIWSNDKNHEFACEKGNYRKYPGY